MASPRDREKKYSPSPSPIRYRSRSPPARTNEQDTAENSGNNLYITGLSTRVTDKELEAHFSREGKVLDCHIVSDPRTKESRGFGFVTVETAEDADRCLKYLDRSILEGRIITVEKAKRKRARTPTPGKYLGVRTAREIAVVSTYDSRRRSHFDEKYRGSRERRDVISSRRSPRYSPYRDAPYSAPFRDVPSYRDAPYRDSGGYRGEPTSYRDAPYRDAPYRDNSAYRDVPYRELAYRDAGRERSPVGYGSARGGGYGRY